MIQHTSLKAPRAFFYSPPLNEPPLRSSYLRFLGKLVFKKENFNYQAKMFFIVRKQVEDNYTKFLA